MQYNIVTGMPNASAVIKQIPKFVSDMGNMKDVLDGSFRPLTERKCEHFIRFLVVGFGMLFYRDHHD